MSIQDFILSAANLIFFAALFPTVRSKDKPHVITSLLTSATLYVITGTYITIDLYYAAIITFMTASLWFVIAVQKYRLNKAIAGNNE